MTFKLFVTVNFSNGFRKVFSERAIGSNKTNLTFPNFDTFLISNSLVDYRLSVFRRVGTLCLKMSAKPEELFERRSNEPRSGKKQWKPARTRVRRSWKTRGKLWNPPEALEQGCTTQLSWRVKISFATVKGQKNEMLLLFQRFFYQTTKVKEQKLCVWWPNWKLPRATSGPWA